MKYFNLYKNKDKILNRIFGNGIKILIQAQRISIFCKDERAQLFLEKDLIQKGFDFKKRKNVKEFVIEIPFKQSKFNLNDQEFNFYFEEKFEGMVESIESDLKYALNNYKKYVYCDCYVNKQWMNGIRKMIDGNLISNIERGLIKNLRVS